MAAQLSNEVRVFNLLVKIPDEGSASHVGRCDFVDGFLLLFLCHGVEDGHHAVNLGEFENLLDVEVVLLLGDEREQARVAIEEARWYLAHSGR